MTEGRTYQIQAITATIGDLVLRQDTLVDIISVESGKVKFYSHQTGETHTVPLMALKMVV